jgi:hypothetical protein
MDKCLMPNQKRFAMNSPRELLAKLDWEMEEYDKFPILEEVVASYRAFNCAVTAWSICDWVWNAADADRRMGFRATSPCPDAKGAEPLAALIRSESRELAICQQLANGAKHFIRTRHNDPNVSSQRLKSVSFFVSKDGQEQHVIPSHGIFVEDGDRMYSDIGLFSRARDFWHEFFDRYRIE